MKKISLCMIARDEGAFVAACLASVRGVADEIVLVDTGSKDNTVAIAKDAGAIVVSHPWQDDFSAARNFALQHATGDFVLVLDADERLAPGDGPLLRAASADPKVICGMLHLHDASETNADAQAVLTGHKRMGDPVFLPRFFRNLPDLRWRGLIHEDTDEWINKHGGTKHDTGARLIHLGACEAIRQSKDKSQRNIHLLQRQCEQEPDNITPMGYLAMEFISRGETQKAQDLIARAMQLLPSQPKERSPFRVLVLQSQMQLMAGQPAQALRAVTLAEQAEGPQGDLHYLRGFAHEQMARACSADPARHDEHVRNAIVSYESALKSTGLVGAGQYIKGATTWAGTLRLATVLMMAHEPARAQPHFERAALQNAVNIEAELGLTEVLTALGQLEPAFEKIQPLLQNDDARQLGDTFVVAAQLTIAAGMRQEAEPFLQRARILQSEGKMTWRRSQRLQSL